MPEITMQIKGIADTMKMLKSVEEFLKSPKPMENIVKDVKNTILVKTALGLDYKGKSFAPYSKAYKKKKTGMTATGRPNLKRTGEMMNSIKTEVISPSHGKVEVTKKVLIAQFHNLGGPKAGRPPQRRFMDLSKSAVLNLSKKYFDDEIQKLLGRR
jgi:phage gpG-like protein